MLSIEVIQQQFRQQTRTHHQALDAQPALRTLLSKTLERKDYTLALERLLVPHAYLEAQVKHGLSQTPQYTYLPRIGCLINDLRLLGVKPSLPFEVPINESPSIEPLVAYLYLLEGSKLGSQHIVRKMTSNGFDGPTSFFDIEDQAFWSRFWQFAQQQLQNKEQLALAVEHAKQAFEFYTAYVGDGSFQPEILGITEPA